MQFAGPVLQATGPPSPGSSHEGDGGGDRRRRRWGAGGGREAPSPSGARVIRGAARPSRRSGRTARRCTAGGCLAPADLDRLVGGGGAGTGARRCRRRPAHRWSGAAPDASSRSERCPPGRRSRTRPGGSCEARIRRDGRAHLTTLVGGGTGRRGGHSFLGPPPPPLHAITPVPSPWRRSCPEREAATPRTPRAPESGVELLCDDFPY
jgi:hypothetical protein